MQLRKSLFWSFSQQFGMMFLQLANMVTIARLLTPDEIGVFVIALSLFTIVQALREMGLSNYIIRAPNLTDSVIRATFGISILLCLVLALALVAMAVPLEKWMDTPGLAMTLLPIAGVIAVFPIEQSSMAILRREMRFDVLARVSVSAKFISVLVSIGLALSGVGTMALVWGLVTEAVLRMVMLARFEARHLRLGPSLRDWRPLLNFGAWVTGASLAGQASVVTTTLMLGSFLGPGATAFFDRASRIPSMARMGLFMPLGRVLLSSFSADLRAGRDIGPKVERVTAITTGIIWPCFAVLAILSEEIIAFLLGEQWGVSARIMPWLLLGQAFLSLLPQPDQVLVPHGKVRRLFALRFFQLMLGLVSSYFLLTIPVEGMAQIDVFIIGRVLTTAIFVAAIWIGIKQSMGSNTARLLLGHFKSLILTLTTSAPLLAWKFAGIGNGSLIVLGAAFVTSIALSILVGLILKHPLLVELSRGAHWVKSRKSRKQPS